MQIPLPYVLSLALFFRYQKQELALSGVVFLTVQQLKGHRQANHAVSSHGFESRL